MNMIPVLFGGSGFSIVLCITIDGKTSGGIQYTDESLPILVHKPHGHKGMWWQDIEKVLEALEKEGLL